MSLRKRVLAVLAIALLLLVPGDLLEAQDQSTQYKPTFEPAACWFEKPIPFLPGPEFECGYVTVPERHEAAEGKQIRIPVAISRAEVQNAKPDPLFLAQGGPGGDAFDIFPVLLSGSPIWRERDVVVFNQRGARYAEPDLSCTEMFNGAPELLTLPIEEADALSLEFLQACYDRLTADGIDLSAYNSLQNAADVNSIRQALGYDEYNFYGVSYGTLLGFHLLRHQPQGLRSVVLDGVVPTDLNFIPKLTENMDRVFTEVIATCTSSPECREEYPDLERRFFDLVDRLNESQTTVSLEDPESGERVEARLDGDTLVSVLFQAFYLPDSYAYFPKLVANLEQGDMTFIEGIWPLFAFDRTISEGMYFSVICAEDADFEPSESNLANVRPYFAEGAEQELQSYRDACDIWEVEKLPDSVDDPVDSDIPALLLSGQYDPITPPMFAEVAAQSLENDRNLVDPTGSHGVAFGDPCLADIVNRFLDNPDSDLDASCLEAIEPQQFAPLDAISFPLVGDINSLEDDLWQRFAVSGFLLLIVLSAFIVLPLTWLIRLLRKKPSPAEDQQEMRLRRIAGFLAILFGFAALVFVAGVGYYTLDSLFSGLASIFAVSSAAAPFFTIPYLLLLLALLMVVVAFLAWKRGYWPTWSRIYFAVVAAAAVAYVLVLTRGGMLAVLL